MITSIQIFGLTLNVSAAGVVAQPNATTMLAVKNWAGQVTGSELRLDAWVEINAIYTFACSLRIALTGDGKPAPQPQLQWAGSFFCLASQRFPALPQRPPVNVVLGPVSASRPDFPDGVLTAPAGALLLKMTGLSLIEDPDLPIQITSGDGGLEVNLKTLTATLGDSAFQHQIAHGTTVASPIPGLPGNIFLLYPRSAPSSAIIDFNLTTTPGNTTLQFVPSSADELWPLHVDVAASDQISADNKARACLALKNHLFQVELGVTAGQPAIQSFRAEARSGGLELISFNYTAAGNQAPAAFASDSALHLLARTGTDGRPSTIHVDAVYQVDNSGKTFSAKPANNAALLHGLATNGRLSVSSDVRLRCEKKYEIADSSTIPSGIATTATSELTLPWLHSVAASTFYMSRPGASYVATGTSASGGAADNYTLSGAELALPLQHPELIKSAPAGEALAHFQSLDTINAKLGDTARAVTHETMLQQLPQTGAPPITPVNLFVPSLIPSLPAGTAPASILPGAAKLADQPVIRDYGPLRVKLTVPGNAIPDYYAVRDPGQISFAVDNTPISLSGGQPEFSFVQLPAQSAHPGTDPPIAILKLSSQLTLADIFAKEEGLKNDLDFSGKKLLKDLLDETVKAKEWVGLLLIKVPLLSSGSQVASAVLPAGLNIAYVALTPRKGAAAGNISVNARLYYQTSQSNPAAADNSNETLYQVKTADISWYDSNLSSYYVEASLQFRGFFGIGFDANAQPDLTFIGTYDRKTQTIGFLGRLPTPLNLLPDDVGFGPFKQVSIRGAQIKFVNGKPTADLEGDITLQQFSLVSGIFDPGKPIQFNGLQIQLPQNIQEAGQFLSIRYGSLTLNFDTPPFSLGFMTLKLDSLVMDWGGKFDWKSLVTLQNPGWTQGLIFSLRLELMKLPELAIAGLDRLTIDFYIGLGQKDVGGGKNRWSADASAIALRAVGFDHLDLNLLRFLEIRADRFQFGQVKDANGTSIAAIELVNVSVLILDRTILKGLTAFIFAGAGSGPSFALFYGDSTTVGPLKIRWALIGHNVGLDPSFATKLIDVGFSNSAQDDEIRESIQQADAAQQYLKPGGRAQESWLFAAAFDVGSIFDGKFLFQDRAYYGIAIGGGIFKDWFGYDIAISVLYIKGDSPNHDSFRITLRVPQVTLPAFTFMGGELMLQIVLDGGFLLDVGFPHLNPDGSRRWYRTLGAIVFPFQASGGFYIQKFCVYAADGGDGTGTGMLISAGYALQAGLGGCFGGGPLTAWVTAGFFYIMEGSVYLDGGDMKALRLSGAVGIVVRGGASLNFWIISASIEIVLSAEARVTLAWGVVDMPSAYKQIGSDFHVAPGAPTVSLDVTLYASASAEACIGGGWFRICASISVTIPIRYHIGLKL